MVTEWGMSESLGPLTYGKRREQIFLGREIAQHRDHSEATAVEIDREVRKIVIGCYDRTHQILKEQADALTRVAEALLEHEVLDAEQIAALVKGEPLPMRLERSTDSREQLEAAREETGDRHETRHRGRRRLARAATTRQAAGEVIGESGLGANRAEVLEADQRPPFFIPQLQPDAFQTSPEGQTRHLVKLGILPETLLETIVRDSAGQMMNVMHADVAREPV